MFASLFLPLLLAGCPMHDPVLLGGGSNGNGDNGPVQPNPMYPPASGTAYGYGEGWATRIGQDTGYASHFVPIRVTVTMLDGFITAVDYYGPGETPGMGDSLMEVLMPLVVASNTFVHWGQVDAIAGVTQTYEGFRDGGQQAVARIIAAWLAEQQLTVSLDRDLLVLRPGEAETLQAAVTPAGTELVWSSSDASVATVSQTGAVTAVAAGQAVITAQTIDLDGDGNPAAARTLVFVF